MRFPYIGITDFTKLQQVVDMASIFKANRAANSNRQLHVGVMMSFKTLNNLPTKFSEVFPHKESIGDIFGCDEVYNCLHYADYDGHPDLRTNLSRAIYFGGIGVRAIQLDMTWPEPGDIASGIHTSRKQVEVILQIGTAALRLVNEDPNEIVERLRDYETVIDRVLLDKSMGCGVGMDANYLIPFLEAIRQHLPWLDLGVAGGLGPDTMNILGEIPKLFSDISIDAQGKLRPSGSNKDPVDWQMANAYLKKALQVLS